MSDKINENLVPDDNDKNIALNDTESNDSEWKFDGVAHTLDDTVVENDEFEILIPKKSEYETRERPSASKTNAAQTAAPSEPREDSKNAVKFFCMAVFLLIFAGVLAFFGVRYYNTPNTAEIPNPGNVCAKISDTDITIGMYNYYYNSTVNYYLQQASYGSIELDSTKSYSSQKTTDADGNEITWEERFKLDTIDQLQRLVAYYEAAQKDGIKVTAEQEKLIKKDLDTIKNNAKDNELSVDKYISMNFGEYCGIDTVEKMERMSYMAQTYLRKASIEMLPDDEQVNDYYEQHKEDYLQVDMCYIIMQYDEKTKTDVIKQAKKYAENIKTEEELKKLIPIVDKELIDAYVKNGRGDEESVAAELARRANMTVTKSNPYQLPQAMIDFLFDENNKKGACRTVADDNYSAVFIVLKTSKVSVYDDEVYSVRHILIRPETDKADDDDNTETVEPTKEQWKAAEEKANKILGEYNSGERTEYNFALLAEKYSEDTGSISSQSSSFGGLYTNTPLGQMVKEFEGWATDKSRNYGDVEIVKSQFGYHIMFFISDGPAYFSECKMAVQIEMEDDFVNAAKVTEYPRIMAKTTVAKPSAAENQATPGTITDDSIVSEQPSESAQEGTTN